MVVLCDTWNWSDDNDTVSGIAILDTTAIPEMRIAKCNFNVVQNSPVSEQTLSTVFWLVLKLPWWHSHSHVVQWWYYIDYWCFTDRTVLCLHWCSFCVSVLSARIFVVCFSFDKVLLKNSTTTTIHSLAAAAVKTVSSENSVYTQTPCRGIRNNYGHHSWLTMTNNIYYTKQII